MDSPQSVEIGLEDMRCCRSCLSVAGQGEMENYIDLLESYSFQCDSPTLLDTFNKYAQLQIAPDDFDVEGYPPCHYMCGRCRQDLRQACEFITRAQLNNQLLMGNYTVAQLNTAAEEFHKFKQSTESKESQIVYQDEFGGSENGGEEEYKRKNYPPSENGEQSINIKDDLGDIIDEGNSQSNDNNSPTAVENLSNKINDSRQTNQHTRISVERVICNEEDDTPQENWGIKKADYGESFPPDADDPCIDDTRKTCFDYKCEFCTSIFEFQRDLLHHYELDHGDKNLNFPCDVCRNSFVTKNALRLHRRQVHQNDEYTDCDLCGRAVLKSFIKVHLRRHKQLKFLCSKCPKICASRNSLRNHMQLHSDERDRNIECIDCGRRFYTHGNLQLHQAVHISPEERIVFECTICSKTFLRKKNLGLHMQMHRGETIDCPHCGKKFVRPKDLEVHIRFHTGDYPYACSMCDRKFAIKGHLNYHEKRHLGVRYKCDECEKTFINLAGLRQHQYEHTGMPLLCGICMRGFPTNFKVRRHLRTVHRHLFKKTGYTDALAKKYITPAPKSNMEMKSIELENVCDEVIEILEEHAQDIPSTMLTN